MRIFYLILALLVYAGSVSAAPVKELYRLGVPTRFSTPVYSALIKSLHDFGYVEGKNLELVKIDMQASRKSDKREGVRRQILEDTDMMFISCDKLEQYYKLNVKKPTLFFGPKGMNYNPPKDLMPYLTGVWRGDVSDVFVHLNKMIPDGQYKSIGIPYIEGSNFEDILPYIKTSAKKVNIDVISKGYSSSKEIEEMMRFFKNKTKAVFFVPPAINDEDLEEIVHWQNTLNLPVISQQEKHVEAGMLGGIVLDMNVIVPKLTEYIDKILNGRKPSQLPVFTSNLKHIINLNVASQLNVKIPRSVIKKSEIIGISQVFHSQKKKDITKIIPGYYRLGMTESIIDEVGDRVIRILSEKGYRVGNNLEIVKVNLNNITSDKGKLDLEAQLNKVDAMFITDNAVYDVVQLNLDTPVILLGISDINDIPENRADQFTGIWRASCRKVLNMAKRMFPDVKRIGMAYRKETRMDQIVHHHKTVAESENIELTIKPYESEKDIPELMRSFKESVDIVLLFPAGVVDSDVDVFIKMQNELELPVLSHLKHHIEMGLVGGPTVDLDQVVPRLAEYIHKVLQGRPPIELKAYQYIPKYVINLKAAGNLDVKIPRSIIRQSYIVN